MKAYDIIDKVPGELAARLIADPFFKDISVVVAEKGNIALELERKMAITLEKEGKRGVAVIVLQLMADDYSNNLQFGPMILKPAFQVVENVEMNNDDNGTKKSARKVARRIRDVIKNCNLLGLVLDMKAGKPCIEPVDMSEIGASLVGYQVNFECLEVSQEDQQQVQMPAFATSTNAFALASATPGAAIWFTRDDSFPYPGGADVYPGSTSELYSGPVSLAAGTFVIRACAYLENQIASGVNRATIVATT